MGVTVREWLRWKIEWDPARNGLKYAAHGYARRRGAWLERTGRVPEVATILAASPPKAGSQWMKALFDHPVVRRQTGLFTLPQLDYKLTPPRRGFPAGTFVPGVYLSYDEYRALPHSHAHRVVSMSRDPRDMVVSGYYSAVATHRRTHLAEVEQLRERLRVMPMDDALLALIEAAAPTFEDMASWVGVADPMVARFRLEDVAADPRRHVSAMLEHCAVRLSEEELEQVLRDVDRSALQAHDLEMRGDGQSHYRLEQCTFRDVFRPEHHAAIEAVAPGLVRQLGYHDQPRQV